MPIKPKQKTEKKKAVNIALTPSLHKQAVAHSKRLNMSLSALIEELLKDELSNV